MPTPPGSEKLHAKAAHTRKRKRAPRLAQGRPKLRGGKLQLNLHEVLRQFDTAGKAPARL